MLHLPSILSYAFLSFSMTFFNKALFEIANFRNNLFVIITQLIIVVVAFHTLGYFHLIKKPIIISDDVRTMLVPSIFYSLTTLLSLQALMKLNVAIYVVIKRCTPPLTFLLSTIVLKKQKLNIKTGLCVFSITIGAIITSTGDLSFHFQSYFIGGLSVLFQSLYLLTIQRCSDQKTSSEVLYINSLLSLPMIFIVMIAFSNELSHVKAYDGFNTVSFWLYFLLSTVGGGILNGTTFWCTMKNSALTTSVVGVLKGILQVIFGMFVFDRLALNFNTLFGITLSLLGGTIFSYLEYTAKANKFILPSSTSMTENECEHENHHHIKPAFDIQEATTIHEKSFPSLTNKASIRKSSTS